MALDLGELVAKLRIDERGMDKGAKKGEAKMKELGDKISKASAAAGLAAGAALVASLLGAINQEALGAKIAAQLGGTADDAKAYGRTAGKLYAEGWGDSIETIGDTLKQVATSGIVDPKDTAALEDLTRRAQTLADVFGQDVEGSVRAVQQLLRTGLVSSATEGFDLIGKAVQGGLDKSGDLLDTINEYSTEFRELGLSGQEAFGLIGQAVKAGARDTDTAADALKEFAIRSKDASTTSAQGFQLLGLNAKQMTATFARGGPDAAAGLQIVLDRLRAIQDPVTQNTAAVDLFGTKAEDLGNSLFAMDLSGAAAGFGDLSGTIDQAAKAAQETDAAKLERFKRSVEQAATALGADLIPYLESSAKWVKQNQEWLKPLAITLGTVAAAIVAVNLAQKAWAATQVAWAAATKVAAAAQWVMSSALFASPITWIVLAIVALIAIIVLIATKTDWFQKLWKFAWGGIKAAALAVWGWIKGTLWPGIKAVFEGIAAVAMWLWRNVFDPVWQGIVVGAKFAWRILSSIFALIGWAWLTFVGKPLLWAWQNLIWPAFQGIGAAASWLWSTVLQPVFGFIWQGMQLVGQAAMWLWNNAIKPAFEGIAAVAMWLWQNVILPTVHGISDAAMWLWNNAIKPVWNAITSATHTVGDVIKTVFGKVSGWISSAFSGAAGIVKGAMNGVISAINGAISGINWVIKKANTIPGVDFPTIPSIPHLAVGGAVQPRPGGTPVVMGDGGEVEYGVPKSDMERIIGRAVAAAGAGGHAEMHVVLELVGDGVLRIVRTAVKRKGLKTLEQTP